MESSQVEGSITEVLPHFLTVVAGVTFDLRQHVIEVAMEVLDRAAEFFDPQAVEIGNVILKERATNIKFVVLLSRICLFQSM